MKKRICIAVLVFFLGAILVLPPVSVDLHLFFSRTGGYGWEPAWAWSQLLQGGKPIQFYALLATGWALALFWAVASSASVQYRSGMYHVAPGIDIPRPEGQGQYGTAWWASSKALRQSYQAALIDKEKLQVLLDAGMQDYKEVENANIKIE